jgi:uncharacterized membrane protein YkvA (DUF1232 family)
MSDPSAAQTLLRAERPPHIGWQSRNARSECCSNIVASRAAASQRAEAGMPEFAVVPSLFVETNACSYYSPQRIKRMSSLQAGRRMKNLLLFIPNLLLLCARLMVDSRVPGKERALVAGALLYALIPLDFIPDMIPFVGQIDDMYLIALTLLRLMTVTQPSVVREHWNGGGDVVEFVGAAAMLAAKLLPKPIRRVLTARVEVDRKEGSLPLLVERAQPDSDRS